MNPFSIFHSYRPFLYLFIHLLTFLPRLNSPFGFYIFMFHLILSIHPILGLYRLLPSYPTPFLPFFVPSLASLPYFLSVLPTFFSSFLPSHLGLLSLPPSFSSSFLPSFLRSFLPSHLGFLLGFLSTLLPFCLDFLFISLHFF